MAGNGRHPKVRLDRDGARACAVHVSNRADALGMPVRVWLMASTGVIVRHRHSSSTDESRLVQFVGEFTRLTPVSQIEHALAPFVPGAGKVCSRCPDKGMQPLSAFHKRSDGRPVAYCKPCAREHNAQYDRKNRKRGVLVHKSDPLNLALRDMPGSRVSLLGIAGVRITEELRAA